MATTKAQLAATPPAPNPSDDYATIAAAQTDSVLGTGAVGDLLGQLICIVTTAATSQVQIKDGNGSAITVLPNNVTPGVGTYVIPLNIKAKNGTTPGWKITTAAGVAVLASGVFT